jgi:hypothetical protein
MTIGPLTPQRVEQIEGRLLQLEQMDAPVVHRFGAGIYIREVHLPAGMLVIGHHHRHAHMNAMISGRATFLNPDGTTTEYTAPFFGVWPAGRKIAIVHEDMIWQNIYPTEETDAAALEDRLLDKSETWLADQSERLRIESFKHDADRADFLQAIEGLGFTPERVREISENDGDQSPMPPGNCKTIIARSPIEGRGVFATCDIAAGELVGVARLDGKRTPIGRFTNHSATPNSEMVALGDNCIAMVAITALRGCQGGNPGDEATVDYRQSFLVGMNHLQKESACPLLQ